MRDRERSRSRDDDEEPRSRRDRDDTPRRESKGKRFQYSRRDPADVKKRASQSAGMYDQIFKSSIPIFTPKIDTSYRLRIMPPTWENADHYGYELFIHSQVGADNQKYICLKKHGKKDEACPLCEAEQELVREGMKDEAYEARAKRSVITYVIDRDKEDEGPKLWRMMWMTDRDIAALSTDKRSNETLFIDDPEEGYDIEFDAVKKGKFAEITAIKIARKTTPLCDDPKTQDKWLDFIQQNPISEVLNFYDEEHIRKASEGKRTKDDDEDDDKRTRSDRKRNRDDDDELRGRRNRDDEDDEPRSRRSSLRDEDTDDEGEIDEPPRRKRSRDEDDDPREEDAREGDKPDRKRSRGEPEDDDEPDEKPRKRAKLSEPEDDEEGDDEPAPRRRR